MERGRSDRHRCRCERSVRVGGGLCLFDHLLGLLQVPAQPGAPQVSEQRAGLPEGDVREQCSRREGQVGVADDPPGVVHADVGHEQDQQADPLDVDLDLARPLRGLVVELEAVLDGAHREQEELVGDGASERPPAGHVGAHDEQRQPGGGVAQLVCDRVDGLTGVGDALHLHALVPGERLLVLQREERIQGEEPDAHLDAQLPLLEAGQLAIHQVGQPDPGGHTDRHQEEGNLTGSWWHDEADHQQEEDERARLDPLVTQGVAGVAAPVEPLDDRAHERTRWLVRFLGRLQALAVVGEIYEFVLQGNSFSTEACWELVLPRCCG